MKIKEIINLIEKHPYKILIMIVIFALIIRLFFFVGYAVAPQHEEIYLNTMRDMYNGNFEDYLSRYKDMEPGYEASSYETHQIRIMLNFPSTICWRLFGISDFSTVMWPLLSSLGLIVCGFFIGKILFDKKVALLTAFLAAFFPIDVINATRLDTDIVMAFFMCLSVLFFIWGIESKENEKYNKKKKIILNLLINLLKSPGFKFLLSGIFLGLAVFTKPLAIILIAVFVIYIIYKRSFNKNLIFFVFGLLLVILIFCIYFQINSNHPFLYFDISSSAFTNYAHDTSSGPAFQSNGFTLWLEEDLPIFYYSPYLLNIVKPGSDTSFPDIWLFTYFLIPLLIFATLKVKIRKMVFPLIWFFFILIYIEVGFSKIYLDGGLNYIFTGREIRYLSILSTPFLLLLSYSIMSISKIQKLKKILFRVIVFLIIFSLMIFSFKTIGETHYEISDPLSDMKDAYGFLSKESFNKIYCDKYGVDLLNLYFGYKETDNIINIEELSSNNELINGSYLIIGGSRNSIAVGSFVESKYPEFTQSIPYNWVLVEEFEKNKEYWRNSNIKIYFIS